MTREYYKWHSTFLNRDMELLVFGHAGTPVLMFPTRTARFYDYENWKIVAAVEDKINAGTMQMICVDSVDIESFYSHNSPAEKMKRHRQYECYILYEVIPLIRYKNINPLTVAGCSFGGYHAVNIGFRYPDFFYKVVGMSARYDLTRSSPTFANLLEGPFNEDIYFNMPSMYIPNLAEGVMLNKLRKLKITIAIGELDPFFENNKSLDAALTDKGIKHDFYVWDDEAHRPRHWRKMVQLYL